MSNKLYATPDKCCDILKVEPISFSLKERFTRLHQKNLRFYENCYILRNKFKIFSYSYRYVIWHLGWEQTKVVLKSSSPIVGSMSLSSFFALVITAPLFGLEGWISDERVYKYRLRYCSDKEASAVI